MFRRAISTVLRFGSVLFLARKTKIVALRDRLYAIGGLPVHVFSSDYGVFVVTSECSWGECVVRGEEITYEEFERRAMEEVCSNHELAVAALLVSLMLGDEKPCRYRDGSFYIRVGERIVAVSCDEMKTRVVDECEEAETELEVLWGKAGYFYLVPSLARLLGFKTRVTVGRITGGDVSQAKIELVGGDGVGRPLLVYLHDDYAFYTVGGEGGVEEEIVTFTVSSGEELREKFSLLKLAI